MMTLFLNILLDFFLNDLLFGKIFLFAILVFLLYKFSRDINVMEITVLNPLYTKLESFLLRLSILPYYIYLHLNIIPKFASANASDYSFLNEVSYEE
jgi:hypothetical protein